MWLFVSDRYDVYLPVFSTKLSRMSVSMSASPEVEMSAGGRADETVADSPESGFSHLMNKDLYPVREKVVGKWCACVCICERECVCV